MTPDHPDAPASPAVVGDPSSTLATATTQGTVVVVDDTPTNVTLLTRLLASAGITRVHGFTDPREALTHCARALPDLVLLDLHMPHLDGFAVMDALHDIVPTGGFLPVLVLTADVDARVREQALAAGAKDFLTKPFDRTEVILRVANLLETRALYRWLEQHNATLQATLDAHTAAERAAAAEDARRRRRIASSLAPEAFRMVFQAVADLSTGDLVGAEALARFSSTPSRPPNEWFTEAAQVGRGTELEIAAISVALDQIEDLPADTFLAVNASPTTAAAPELDKVLASRPAGHVVLELTEHSRVTDYDTLLSALARHRQRGVRIAVDDTGAGYAGLEHLLRIRPDILKLDTTLTRGIDTDPVRRSLAAALVTFASETDATIIAEGIETPQELATLQQIGIPWGQGYHLARPAALPLPSPPLPRG